MTGLPLFTPISLTNKSFRATESRSDRHPRVLSIQVGEIFLCAISIKSVLTLIASTSRVDPNSVSSVPFSLIQDERGDVVDNKLLGVAEDGPPHSIDKGSS